ncbi:Flp pilus assembly protein CpaB [Alcanivorax sp. JB21]|uniref:Flp pilus assembly protein CpaB n=1 Tax=Alcanivorax limicola TaxID=2874102 RepID=UPI001CBE08E9|nr:Flp pilus assembly protein CpaB [Alcanivorax limicola]MBZ2189077.1 Flp pilus assembly protein CpaB [Alcanivorax limicola]
MSSSRAIYMLPALVLSVLAIVLAIIGLSREPTPAEPEVLQVGDATPQAELLQERHRYWALSRSVEAGTALTEEQLLVMRSSQAIPGAVSADDEAVGLTVRRNVRAGEILSGRHLEAGGPLANALLPGFRAIAIPVDDVSAVGGLLEPGDMVDVLATFRAAEDQRGDPTAMLLMRDVELLAIGGLMDAADADPANRDRRGRGNTAVLAVPEKTVSRLLLAAANGSLRLSAVSAQDMADMADMDERIERVAVQPGEGLVRYRELFPAPPPPPRAAPRPRGHQVEIIEGSETRSVNVRP